jgi:hypothetical protein
MAARTIRSVACNSNRCRAPDGGFNTANFGLCANGDAGLSDPIDDAGSPAPTELDTFDDLCEFRMQLSAVCGADERTVTISMKLTASTDDRIVVGAAPYAEVYLTPTHPARVNSAVTTDLGAGWYEIGPYQLDTAGTWTFEIHTFPTCILPGPNSPHAHLSIRLDVP